ncbi:MAG: cobalt-precorrin hydrolase / cobalt-factor methyltransferase / precorrin-3B [Frankiales bacterium]|nr:cobalt-precorrin hydrolase / cobalt-factor methyltransferase / precorrin-3B [Frankiales bacterium]
MIGLVAATAAGRRHAERLAGLWPDAKVFGGPASSALPAAWTECTGIVAFLSVGATVRLLAPHLGDKHTDPGVVCVDEAGRWAVPVLGAHGGAANALAARVGEALGSTAVITTGSDSIGLNALDQLGWAIEGDAAAVARAMLDGEDVTCAAAQTWPLPPLPVRRVPYAELVAPAVVITDRLLDALPTPCVVLRPPSLVLGIGASRNAPAAEIEQLVSEVLRSAGLSVASVFAVATAQAKADEAGILEVCAGHGWSLTSYAADLLAEVAVPNPSAVVLAAVGTPSVAEASALLHAGPGAELVVGKRASAMATVAVARARPRGRLTLVGLGPGARDLLSARAAEALARSGFVVGLDQYVAQVRDLVRPGTVVLESGLGQEEERARTAVDLARAGNAVALIGSGDAGVYAMASPALELADESFDVVGVPGITAALAAAALLGAPLGHDHAAISLSDLHTPWPAIERRVRAAAEGDFVVTFYNPRSRGRDHQLPDALDILREHRPPTTPVGLVRDASRPGQRVLLSTLAEVRPADVDMLTVVVVGSSQTVEVAGRMVTPRGYRWA